jgi:hypothetical protein
MILRRSRQTSVTRGLNIAWLVLAFLCTAFQLLAQSSPYPTVTLTFDFPGSEPEHFVFSVASDGRSSYDSNGRLTLQSEVGEPFHLDFMLSKSSSDRIFDLAKRAHYFEGNLDSGKSNIAFMGKKVLSYKDGQKNTQATYNFSLKPPVQELTNLFQSLSSTLEFGRRLEYYQHYQKLALDEETKRMEAAAMDNNLIELSAVSSILRSIANDNSVMNVVRARALRLLARPAAAAH